jgi:hypothetical protein
MIGIIETKLLSIRTKSKALENVIYTDANEARTYLLCRELTSLRGDELALMNALKRSKENNHMSLEVSLSGMKNHLNQITNLIVSERDPEVRRTMKELFFKIAAEYQKAVDTLEYF